MHTRLVNHSVAFSSTIHLSVDKAALAKVDANASPDNVYSTLFRGINAKVNDFTVALEGSLLTINDGCHDTFQFQVDPSQTAHQNEDALLRAANLSRYITDPSHS